MNIKGWALRSHVKNGGYCNILSLLKPTFSMNNNNNNNNNNLIYKALIMGKALFECFAYINSLNTINYCILQRPCPSFFPALLGCAFFPLFSSKTVLSLNFMWISAWKTNNK